jgi:hypothetical protein
MGKAALPPLPFSNRFLPMDFGISQQNEKNGAEDR